MKDVNKNSQKIEDVVRPERGEVIEAKNWVEEKGIAQRHKRQRIAIIVAGMHRSGTSALTRTLSLLGCDLPKTLIPPSPGDNDLGFWESQVVMQLNNEILSSAGTAWNDWAPFNLAWYDSPVRDTFHERAQAVLESEFGASRLFVLKDPRICRIMRFWIEVLSQSGVQPRIICPLRNPLEVAASLEKRNGLEPSLGHLLWLRHVLDAEFASRGLPRFFTSYDSLMTDWGHMVEKAQLSFDLAWPRNSDRVMTEIQSFLSDNYRHYHVPRERIIDNPTLSKWLRDSFSILSKWEHDGEITEDFPLLDRIREEFNTATPAFSRLIDSGQKSSRRVQELKQNIVHTQEKLKEAKEITARHQGRVKELEEQIVRSEMEKNSAREQLRHMSAMHCEHEKLLTNYKHYIELLMADVKQRQSSYAELKEVRSSKQRLESKLKERFDEIATLTRIIQERDAEIENIRQEKFPEVEADKAEKAKLKQQLHQYSTEVVSLKNALQVKVAEIENFRRDRTTEIEKAMTERESLESKLKERFNEIATLTRIIHERDAEIENIRKEKSAEVKADKAEKAKLEQQLHQNSTEVVSLKNALQEKAAEIEKIRRDRATEIEKAKTERESLESKLKERFNEIAILTKLLQENENIYQASVTELGRITDTLLEINSWSFLPENVRLKQKISLLKRHSLFDPEWYLNYYKDVADAGVDPWQHYIKHGIKEGRKPNRMFDAGKG